MQAHVVEKGRSSNRNHFGCRQTRMHRRLGRELGHTPGVAGARRRTQVGEIRDRLQGLIELGLGEAPLQRRVAGDHCVPVVFSRRVPQHIRRNGAEEVDDGRIELRTTAAADHINRGGRPAVNRTASPFWSAPWPS